MTKSEQERQAAAEVIQDTLRQFHGSELYYQHTITCCGVVYTEGVQYLAEAASAYWLIDAIASYFGDVLMTAAMKRDERLRTLQFWKLERLDDGDKALLTAVADKGCPPFVEQYIEYTDFPLEEVRIWAGFDGKRWVLYLPSEH